ncbi:FAD/NAD(P)-binding protein [Paenibacillus sp. SYP-B3998]|uniref:FAD/NAD(P)-binding protein n=1 Tax=Paenibacillus sp. SYP-B3998 TaxID=2678564 RepID=A0A6G3ZTX8_9BACL|nr:FAD/NAD(P)-binding protein [Paenibacillus sp. SYP-B3998]NEW05663.1 FAD/NAD(P)-binding protein [Paenibacillus sp. SYP-B3998]
MRTYSIGIIGCGPWGLAVLERTIAHFSLEAQRDVELHLHIIEPDRGGTGVYSDKLPEFLLLNTECGNINLFGSTFMGLDRTRKEYEVDFYEWLRANRYQVEDAGVTREVKPTDFVARKWLGNYLHWVFQTLFAHLPKNLYGQVHKMRATNIIKEGDKERIELENRSSLLVDTIFLTIGHADTIQFESGLSSSYLPGEILPPFPHQRVQAVVQPGESLLLAGMGLAAIDVISYLTIGRGGLFTRLTTGELTYKPSGKEPRIIQFSRSGLPFRSRPSWIKDTAGMYKPLFLTKERIDELRQEHKQLDFREHVLTLLYSEMKTVFYCKTAEILKQDIAPFILAYREQAFSQLEQIYGAFDPEEAVFGTREIHHNSTAYQVWVTNQLESDIDESKSDTESPSKAAIELIRVLRDVIRYAVDFGGLSESSFRDFRTNILPMFYRAVVGPPVHKTEQLLALMKAGVLEYSLGRAPVINYEAEIRRWRASSVHLDSPIQIHVSHYVKGYNDPNLLDPPSSGLLQNLLVEGRIKSSYSSMPLPGLGIECDRDFHPINKEGEIEEHIYILGLLTDGKRNFNLYIPSPNSRARAFLDADQCVVEVLKKCKNNKIDKIISY